MINGETMVVLIVLIAVVGGVLRAWLGSGRNAPGQPPREPPVDAEAQRLRDEVRLLKDRIQVLERVITDNHASNDLDREIDKLRDR